jgi:hypothetical protein
MKGFRLAKSLKALPRLRFGVAGQEPSSAAKNFLQQEGEHSHQIADDVSDGGAMSWRSSWVRLSAFLLALYVLGRVRWLNQ